MKLHQNIIITGQNLPYENPKRQLSKFWNEGKWNNFINPLLPIDCKDKTFVEIGCNAGLYLKMARDKGFRHVIGIEMFKQNCKWAEKYRNSLGYNYTILNREVGKNFSFDELPVADITLISNVHYYIDLNSWIKYLDVLQYKTCYCLIVSRPLRHPQQFMPKSELSDLRYYFKNWAEMGVVDNVSRRHDPHPRHLWSILFKSTLQRTKISDISYKTSTEMDDAMVKLARVINQDGLVDPKETEYYQNWYKRKVEFKEGFRKWKEEQVYEFVKNKIALMYDVKMNGLKNPLLISSDSKLLDGGHRLAMIRELRYESVIIRTI